MFNLSVLDQKKSKIFVFENRQQCNARAGKKKTCFLGGNARPESKAHAHLKRRKKHSRLRREQNTMRMSNSLHFNSVVLYNAVNAVLPTYIFLRKS